MINDNTTIPLKQGDTLLWECEYTNDAGSAVDLTNYTIKCQARDSYNLDTILFDLSIGSGITVHTPLEGKFRIEINDTTTFKEGNYKIDIQYSIDNIIKSSETFTLIIEKDITK